jgi:multiple sugar transport system substrate-binding protein
MKIKKITLAILIVIIAGVGSLFATGTEEMATPSAKTEVTTVTFWSLFTGGDGEFFDAMVDEFNATHTDIQMKTDTVKHESYYTKLTAALVADNAPDMIVCHQARLRNYILGGQLLPLDKYLEEINAPMDDFIDAPLNACMYEGKIYALPLDVHPIIMFANKDLLAEAGIAELPTTMDELIADAKAVQEKTGAMGIACDNTTAVYKAYTLSRLFFSMMYQQGGQMLTDDYSAAAFNNEKGVKALQALVDMVNKNKVTPAGLDYDTSVNSFKLGEAAFHFNGVWATGTFNGAEGLNFDAVPLPGLLGKPAAWGGSHTLAIPAVEAKDPEQLKSILKCILWITEHGEMWAKAGQIPTRKSVQASDAFKALPYLSGYAASAESTVAPPSTPAWSEIYGTLSDKLEWAVAKNLDPKQALDDIEKTVNKIIETY